MPPSIVFGTTLAPDCRPLADVAALLAKRLNAPLRFVHVSEDARAPIVLGTDEEHIPGRVRAELDEEAARLRTATGGDVHVHLAAGSVVDALLSVARFEMATALVVGGSSAGGRAFLGTTAERAARQSTVPALTLRAPGRLLSWLRGERPLRVLVGADLGRASEAARVFASTLGAVGPVEVEVVLVASPAEVHERFGLGPPESEHHLSSEAEGALLRDLKRTAPPNEAALELRVLAARGSADAHLASLADQGDFDLVVVGQAQALAARAALVRLGRTRCVAVRSGERRLRSGERRPLAALSRTSHRAGGDRFHGSGRSRSRSGLRRRRGRSLRAPGASRPRGRAGRPVARACRPDRRRPHRPGCAQSLRGHSRPARFGGPGRERTCQGAGAPRTRHAGVGCSRAGETS